MEAAELLERFRMLPPALDSIDRIVRLREVGVNAGDAAIPDWEQFSTDVSTRATDQALPVETLVVAWVDQGISKPKVLDTRRVWIFKLPDGQNVTALTVDDAEWTGPLRLKKTRAGWQVEHAWSETDSHRQTTNGRNSRYDTNLYPRPRFNCDASDWLRVNPELLR